MSRRLKRSVPAAVVAALACGGALASGSDPSDEQSPWRRRHALWTLFAENREAAFAWMEAHADENAAHVGVLMAQLARQMPETRRNAFLRKLMTAQQDGDVRREASRAMGFPFHCENLPVSLNPANDHPVTLVKSLPLPLEGWWLRLDPAGDGHLGAHPYHEPSFRPDRNWIRTKVGCCWEEIPEVGRTYDGVGWYRLEWTLPPKPADANVFELAFGGVDEEAWIWINGTYVGQHAEGVAGWDKPFRLDVARVLKWGEKNVILIRVNDTENGGGIWKPITLEALKCDF